MTSRLNSLAFSSSVHVQNFLHPLPPSLRRQSSPMNLEAESFHQTSPPPSLEYDDDLGTWDEFDIPINVACIKMSLLYRKFPSIKRNLPKYIQFSKYIALLHAIVYDKSISHQLSIDGMEQTWKKICELIFAGETKLTTVKTNQVCEMIEQMYDQFKMFKIARSLESADAVQSFNRQIDRVLDSVPSIIAVNIVLIGIRQFFITASPPINHPHYEQKSKCEKKAEIDQWIAGVRQNLEGLQSETYMAFSSLFIKTCYHGVQMMQTELEESLEMTNLSD